MSTSPRPLANGDLNNTSAARQQTRTFPPDPAYATTTLGIPESEDDPAIRAKYRPFLLPPAVAQNDWIAKLELSTALKLSEADLRATGGDRLKVLVLYGSLRARSYSRLLAYEQARILWRLGCDVRVFDPHGLPVKDDVEQGHAKVVELRELSRWSDGHVWVSPEQHGILTAAFKNQIDWIPLSTGSVRPTQGRTLAVSQVSGGSQSFNTVNALRVLGRWMRMFVIPNQSSVPKAYTQFTDAVSVTTEGAAAFEEAEGGSRMTPSGNRDRVVDCMEEFLKFTLVMRRDFDLFGDRYSERVEREEKARLEGVEREKREVAGREGNASSIGTADVVNGVDVQGI